MDSFTSYAFVRATFKKWVNDVKRARVHYIVHVDTKIKVTTVIINIKTEIVGTAFKTDRCIRRR